MVSDTECRGSMLSSTSRHSNTVENVDPGSQLSILRRRRSDIETGTISTDDVPKNSSKVTASIKQEEQAAQDRRVCIIRSSMIATLITATVVVATLTYVYVHNGETDNFVSQYHDSVAKVAEAFQGRLDALRDSASTFSAVYTSRYGNDAQIPPVWPNATMLNFQEQAAGQLRLVNGRALSFNPIITQGINRLEWEAHAEESAFILGASTLMEPATNTTWPDNRTVAFGIYSRDPETVDVIYDPGYAPTSVYPDVMVPVWQIAPIVSNEKAVMFNLHSEPNRQRALDDMLTQRVPTLTAILQLVQDVDLRPSTILFYPVMDEFNESIPNVEKTTAGSISIVFSWDDLLGSVLPAYIKGMICVLKSSVNQTYTYSISGDEATLLGEGDLHDPKFSNMGETFRASLAKTEEEPGQVDDLITYSITMYPSQELQDQYVTNRAIIYTVGVVLIFVCTAGLFLLYDYLVENRQQKTARLARQTGNIVDSMFPAAFQERLYKSQQINSGSAGPTRRSSINSDRMSAGDMDTVNRKNSNETQATLRGSNADLGKQTKRFSSMTTLKQLDWLTKGATKDHNVSLGQAFWNDEPIAELFLDTSIMFSDIVGFTKWCSERAPHEVFRLLERLFWEFDAIAEMLNVFKLGTIGDCYIAVTGIPEPIDDHATVLTDFTFKCRDKVREVCAELEQEGLDTAKLDMRFGIHSGATTAGILRGTKSRFELFGDTINTASRMESTGEPGKIQVSGETAKLMRLDGKVKWLTKRDEMITAKGKGQLQTYWAEPSRDIHRVSFSDAVEGIPMDEKFQRFMASSRAKNSSKRSLDQVEDVCVDYDEERAQDMKTRKRDDILDVYIPKNDDNGIESV